MPRALRYKDPSIVPVMKDLLEMELIVKVGETVTIDIKEYYTCFSTLLSYPEKSILFPLSRCRKSFSSFIVHHFYCTRVSYRSREH